MLKTNLYQPLFYLILFTPLLPFAQVSIPKKVNNEMSVELKAVQTPSNTFVAAIMTTKTGGFNDNISKVYRSADNGQTWDSVFAVLADSNFARNPDPVLCMDNAGTIYLILMRINKGTAKGQLWCYKSTDDGKTWSLAGKPYQGNSLPDYPQCIAKGNGEIYLTFLEYPSPIQFVKSMDGGKTWSTGIALNDNSQAGDPIGADIGWTGNGNICVAYGTYSQTNLYISTSSDLGQSWSPATVVSGINKLSVNKIISSTKFAHLGVLSHRPHNSQTTVIYSKSEDAGKTWFTQVLDSNASLAEGLIDNSGNIHVVYNKNVGNKFSLLYVFSSDKGKSFSKPSVLYTAPMNIGMAFGEYQSLILASDGLFHSTFIDFGDNFKAKQLVFSPMLSGINGPKTAFNAPLVYPNPANNTINISMDDLPPNTTYQVYDFNGLLIKQGNLTSSKSTIDANELKSNKYLLRINQGNRVFINKIVVQ